MQLYRLIARLLDYPSAELLEHLPQMAELAETEPDMSEQERKTLKDTIAWMQMHTLTGLQETYVQTFDMTPEHDLHLTGLPAWMSLRENCPTICHSSWNMSPRWMRCRHESSWEMR